MHPPPQSSPLYRLQQFWWNLNARPLSATQKEEIAQHLTPAQFTLYQTYTLTDQQHTYRVLQTLLKAGYNHPDLLTAGLLHDVGKTKTNMTLIDRVIIVLGKQLAPQTAHQWGHIPLQQAKRWQRPFIVRQQHPQWSADMVQQIDTTPLALQLIKHHQDQLETIQPPPSPSFRQLLPILQWADDLN